MRTGPSSTLGAGTWATIRSNIGARSILGTGWVGGHPAIAAGAVEHGEIELLVGGVEVGEQIEDLVQHVEVALVRAIDLVDRDDRAQTALQSLGDHEFGLRQRAFRGVDQHDDAVDHAHDALDLAAKIGVAGRVDDVDARAFQTTLVHFARMVMPRSRSRSLLSMARSVTFWLSRKAPDCFRSWSTSVVLPWST